MDSILFRRMNEMIRDDIILTKMMLTEDEDVGINKSYPGHMYLNRRFFVIE